MKILLIGANGQLGSDIKKVFRKESDIDLVPLTDRDIDVTDDKGMESVIEAQDPDLIINTAAFVNVDLCEDEIELSFRVNAFSQKTICRLCRKIDCRYIVFGTDYVFDGNQRTPYKEEDKPGPINMYGISKLAGEQIVQYMLEKYYIIRVSGLYGVSGPVGKKYNFVDIIWERAQKGETLDVVDDQRLTPTSTWDVANKLLELIPLHGYGIYHMTNTGDCTWYEFAEEIVKLGDFKTELRRVKTGHFGEKAIRPGYSVLDNVRLREAGLKEMPHWKDALADYIKRKYGKGK